MNKLILLAGMAAMGIGVTEATAQTVELKFADQFPTTHIASTHGAQAFIEEVERLAGDKIDVTHYPAEQLAKANGMLDAVTRGVSEIANVAVSYTVDRMPLTSVAELPGLYSSSVEGTEAFNALIEQRLLEEEYLPNDVRPLWVAIYPSYQIMMSEDEKITDIAQLNGKKLRAAGATTELMAQAMGAVPVKITPPEMYLAISRGVVDGILYNLPSVFGYKFEEVLSSYTTNAGLGSVVSIAFINNSVWEDLPPDVQDVLAEAGRKVGEEAAIAIDQSQIDAQEKLRQLGHTVYELPEDVLAAFEPGFETVRETWIEQVSSRGLPAQETLDAFVGFLED